MQVNANRSPTAHGLLLELAYKQQADIILVQEPWVHSDLGRRITKWHPAYSTYTPVEDWSLRPRVMTYARKDRRGLRCEPQGPTPLHPDIAFLEIGIQGSLPLLVANIYNAPCGSERAGEAAALLMQQTNTNCMALLTGDFNLRHAQWDSSHTAHPSAQARQWLDWCDSQGLTLLNDPAIPTNRQGSTIDLVWATASLLAARQAAAWVEEKLKIPSDHHTLWIHLPGGTGAQYGSPGRFKIDSLDNKLYSQVLTDMIVPATQTAQQAWAMPAGHPDKHILLDRLAVEITTAVQTGLQAAAKRPSGKAKGYPWWDQDCQAARKDWHEARKQLQRALEAGLPAFREACTTAHRHHRLIRAVKRAKRTFYNHCIDKAVLNKDFFSMTRWASSTGQFKSPPLTNPDGSTATRTEDKIQLLRATHLCTRRDELDTSMPELPPGVGTPQWPALARREAEQALLNVKNTAPGQDEIPPAAIKKAWPYIGDAVFSLYALCLQEGWHPTVFRGALLCTIEKPGKRDRSLPRSYRLIALLSVLGKGLERVIARRLAWEAVTRKVLPPGYFGALPQRSAVDLAQLLVDDIQQAFARGHTTSTITFDVQGAFDIVLPHRLLTRLIEQNWPSSLIHWVRSFLTGRSAAVRLDGVTGPKAPLTGSLPQGSPVSPILFMLYMQPLFTMKPAAGALRRRGYADDGRITASSPSLEQNCQILEQELKDVMEWCHLEQVPLDLTKSELMHFSRKRDSSNPPVPFPQGAGAGEETHLHPVPANSTIRWLGIHFDRALSFRQHVEKMAAKGRKVACALRMLGGTKRGAPAALLRKATLACVVPVLTYAAEAWWPPPNTATRRVRSLAAKLETVQNIALRATLPVYRTTPTPLLQLGAGIPPITVTLDSISRRAAARLARLDPAHPVHIRTNQLRKAARQMTSLGLLAVLPPSPIAPDNPLARPPWHRPPVRDAAPAKGESTSTRVAAFQAWQTTTGPRSLWLYTDGSKLQDRRAGAGWVLYCAGRRLTAGHVPLGPHYEIYDAEAEALRRGLHAAVSHSLAPLMDALWACLDNQAVVNSIYSLPTGTSASILQECQELLTRWETRPQHFTALKSGGAGVIWVPSHAGLTGNEEADREAKAGAGQPLEEHPQQMSGAGARRWVKDSTEQDFTAFHQSLPYRQQQRPDCASLQAPPELLLPRAALARLLAARSGHGDFAAYHDRFNHPDAERRCRCGAFKAPTHFFYCRRARHRELLQGKDKQQLSCTELLRTIHGAQAFSAWLTATDFYREP